MSPFHVLQLSTRYSDFYYIVVSIFTLYSAIFTLPNGFSSSSTLISRLLSSRPGWTLEGLGWFPHPLHWDPDQAGAQVGLNVQWAQTWERWAHGLVGTNLRTLLSLSLLVQYSHSCVCHAASLSWVTMPGVSQTFELIHGSWAWLGRRLLDAAWLSIVAKKMFGVKKDVERWDLDGNGAVKDVWSLKRYMGLFIE